VVPADDAAKLESPVYVPVTESVPRGAWVEVHDPEPAERVAVQMSVVPMVKVTVPLGVPVPEVDATVAE
jgi:hypothetical protein